ncbi:MAG: hypothetical protein ASARMPRED_000935 [Alectoria sarmentosa]|nr:MAG: hypothetical protein ASARMPRED_000935 [Alectoria sarmentosa]
MVQYIPPPDYRSLLPPLLACLPTAFVSPRAPPALLSLLSPILRQRVQLLAATSSSASDSWLPLLCWESEPAKRLVDIVSESDAFELHPASGEIDFGDVEDISYRRLDEETLQARAIVTDLGLIIIYLWCEGDQEGGGDGWRVSEVRPVEGDTEVAASNWCRTIADADEKAKELMMQDAIRQGEYHSAMHGMSNDDTAIEDEQEEDDDDDDDYWAQYDKTPARTPATQRSPATPSNPIKHVRTTSDAEYFARYAQVQPEMDNDDPSEDRGAIGESTLNGNVMASSMRSASEPDIVPSRDTYALPSGPGAAIADEGISHPTASPPEDPAAVSRLEEFAESQSTAEVAAKQHVSTSIKSLFRLCRSSGMERSDFDRMVRTELETLSMMEEDD